MDKLSGLRRIQFAKLLNASKGVIDEMGADLADHGGDAALRQLGIQGVALGFQLLGFCGGIDVLLW